MRATPLDGDFPKLVERERAANKAAHLLERAARSVTAMAPTEDWAGQALRLRGAASIAETAAQELRELVGYLEAAHEASVAGVLEASRHEE